MLPGICASLILTAGAGGGGGGGSPVYLQGETVEHIVADPLNAQATWTLNSAGTVAATGTPGYTWRLAGVSADYEISFDGGGAWLPCSTTRSISKLRTNIGTSSQTYDIRIRNAVTLVELVAVSVTLWAEVD